MFFFGWRPQKWNNIRKKLTSYFYWKVKFLLLFSFLCNFASLLLSASQLTFTFLSFTLSLSLSHSLALVTLLYVFFIFIAFSLWILDAGAFYFLRSLCNCRFEYQMGDGTMFNVFWRLLEVSWKTMSLVINVEIILLMHYVN